MNIIQQFFSLLIEMLESIFKFAFEFMEVFISGIPKKSKGYNAEFASASILLSRRQYGFCLTGKRNLSVKDSFQNALIIGGTGVGKSSVVLIPSLFTMEGSFIVHDPSGELYSKSAGYLNRKGYEVKLLNFARPAVSCGYNPLTRASTPSDVQKVASMLVLNALGGNNSKDPFWNTQATALLTMLITVLKKQDEQYQNLFNVRQLLSALGSNPEAVDSLFSKHADEILFSEYKSFVAYDDKVVNGVIATCKAALQIFSDDSVARVTSFDNLDMREFRNKPTVLYIQNSVADQKYYSVLTSLFFEQFFSFILSRFPQNNEQDIFFLIDESSSLNLPTLPLAVANVRKHRSGIMLLVQDFAQVIHSYGKQDADAIKSNCFAKMFFTGGSHELTKELEQTLGKFEYEDENDKKIVRSLMTNDEIRTMKINRALLVCGYHPPIMARLKPYFKIPLYIKFSSISVPITSTVIPDESIPILKLKSSKEETHA
jgi:type IV secretion system protein VirD4